MVYSERLASLSTGLGGEDGLEKKSCVDMNKRRERWKFVFPIFAVLAGICFGDAVEIYNEAVASFERGEYLQAAQGFQSFLKESPAHARAQEALYWTGESLFQEGRFEEAKSWFQRGGRGEQGTWRLRSLVRLAQCAEEGKKFSEALQSYEAALADEEYLGPGLRDIAFLGRGHCLSELQRAEEAMAAFQEAAEEVTADESRAYALYAAGWSAKESGNAEQAAAFFRELLEDFPNSEYMVEASYEVALHLLSTGRSREAVQLIELVLEERPGSQELLFVLGGAYHREGRLEEAEAMFDKAAQRSGEGPLHADALFNQGSCLIELGRHQPAVERFREAASIDPRRFGQRGAYWQGVGLHRMGEDELAVVALGTAREGEDAKLRCMAIRLLADIAREGEDFEEALRAYEELSSCQGSEAQAFFGQAGVLVELGRPGEAAALYRKVWEEYPEEEFAPRAVLAEGNIHLEEGSLAEAKNCFQEMLRVWPEHPRSGEALLGLGWCHHGEEEFAEAKEFFVKAGEALKEVSFRQEALCMAGASLLQGGEWEGALRPLGLVVSLDAESTWGRQGRLHLGQALCEGGRYQEALEVLSELPEEMCEARFWRGWCMEQSKDFQAASRAYEGALQCLDGGELLANAMQGLSRSLREMGEEEKALLWLERFVESFPDHPGRSGALFLLGEALFDKGEYEAAARRYEGALSSAEKEVEKAKLLYRIGWCHRKRDRWEDAGEAFEAVASEEQGSSLALEAAFLAAESYVSAGDGEGIVRAARLFDDLGEKGQEEENAWSKRISFWKGCALALLGHLEEAEEALRSSLERRGSDEAFQAAMSLAKGYEAERKWEQAARYYATAFEHAEGLEAWGCLMSSASCLEEANRWAEAGERYYRVALLSRERSVGPKAGLCAAEAFGKAGMGERRRQALETAVELYPTSEEAAEARRLMLER